ncbi:MAG: hypothetical protein ACM3ML_32445 [Micromonosporaceae bacterium]
MRHSTFWRLLVVLVAAATAAAVGAAVGATSASAGPRTVKAGTAAKATTARSSAAGEAYTKPDCGDTGRLLCTEVADYQNAFHYYIGHDEPSVLFYSNKPGSGNRMQYQLTLPREPSPKVVPGRSWDFQLTPAIWFGMAMCDTQSYPQQKSTCTPDSDSNITSDANLASHSGTAFMELQFYPPGWVKQFNSQSCDARDWCAALTIDSLSEDPVNGTTLNTACQNQILGGLEYVNFAFLTKTGKPIGPPNPLQFDPATSGNPNRQAGVLFMRPGDHLTVTLHDTPRGLRTVVHDSTTGQTGVMTASAANGFGQINAAPTGTSCTETPYNFHPMYSTSSPATRVPWAAHSYNIAFDEEIGHFDYCSAVDPATGNCVGLEGAPGNQRPADGDDTACFDASQSLLVQVSGCNGTNDPGFDGTSYLKDWPDGNTFLHPTPQLFSSPLTGSRYNVNYSQAAFESDTPRIEAPDLGGVCDRSTGQGCTLVPPTDSGVPAAFYPFFSATGSHSAGGCKWFIGNDVPGLTATDFGKVNQYGSLLSLAYLAFGGQGATITRFNDFRNVFKSNPCPAR